MRVEIGHDCHPTIINPDDCASLSVAAPGPGPLLAAARQTGGLVASVESRAAWLDIDRLRSTAQPAGPDPDWHDAFDRMIEFARRRGWIGAGGTTVRAHIESGASS